MKRVTDKPPFREFNLLSKTQRKLAGFVGEGSGDFEHHPDLTRRKAVEDDFSGVAPIADDWLAVHGYDLPEGSEARRLVLAEFAKGGRVYA